MDNNRFFVIDNYQKGEDGGFFSTICILKKIRKTGCLRSTVILSFQYLPCWYTLVLFICLLFCNTPMTEVLFIFYIKVLLTKCT